MRDNPEDENEYQSFQSELDTYDHPIPRFAYILAYAMARLVRFVLWDTPIWFFTNINQIMLMSMFAWLMFVLGVLAVIAFRVGTG